MDAPSRPRRSSGSPREGVLPPARTSEVSPPPSPRVAVPILGPVPTLPRVSAGGGQVVRPPSPRGAGVVHLRDTAGRGRGRGRGSSAVGAPEEAPEEVEVVQADAKTPSIAIAAPVSSGARPVLKALTVVRERSRGVDAPPPPLTLNEYRPLQQGATGKTRRNSLATMFTGDPVLRMVQLLCQLPFYVERLAHLVDSSDVQKLADALVNVSVPFGRTLFLAKAMIESEFSQNKSQVASILRGNSATSKLMGSFSFFVGTSFLDALVGDYVRKIVQLGDSLTLEVDPAREPSAEKRAKNRTALKEWTRQLVETMSSEKMIASVPPEICSIAKFTADNAAQVCPENLNQLVGGYFMLRLVNPVLVAPEAYRITSTPPTPHARRNLTLISKLLQNISNGAVSTSKEAFMADFSDFVRSQNEKFNGILAAIVRAGVDTTSKPPIPVDEADVGFIEGRHLWFLQHLLQQKSEELSKTLVSLQRNTLPEMELLNILQLVKRDQEPLLNKPVVGQSARWIGKHLRSGTITKKGDKKRKKHKRRFRVELTRSFLFFFEQDEAVNGESGGGAAAGAGGSIKGFPSPAVVAAASSAADSDFPSGRLVKCIPLKGLLCSQKQVKKETTLELTYFGRVHEFVNHELSESVTVWAQSIAAALEFEHTNPHAGNERFYNVPSKGAVADVLTAFNSIPRLSYGVTVSSKCQPKAVVISVAAFEKTWEVPVTLERAVEIVDMIQAEQEELLVPPVPHVLTRSLDGNPSPQVLPHPGGGANPIGSSSSRGVAAAMEKKADYLMHADASGKPLGGLAILQDWTTSFLEAMQVSSLVSHSKGMLELLQLSSPFRAVQNASLAHLRWIHRYFVGGLAVKNSRGLNALMQLVSEPPSSVDPEHVDMIKFLVDSKAVNVKDVDAEGNSALHRAILAKNYNLAQILSEMGVGHFPNKGLQYPLHLLVGVPGAPESLLETCAEECPASLTAADSKGRTPLHLAILAKNDGFASRLFALCMKAGGGSKDVPELAGALHLALQQNEMTELSVQMMKSNMIDLAFINAEGQSALHVAAQQGNLQAVELLLASAAGASCLALRDKHQSTPLLCASSSGSAAVVRLLLPLSDVNVVDDHLRTPLLCAASGGNAECVALLLEKGADPNAADMHGRSPLLVAARAGAVDVVEMLLAKGCTAAGCDVMGMTALMAAAQAHSVPTCKVLIDKLGDDSVKAQDKSKHDALHYAVESFPANSEDTELIVLLVSHGAKPGALLYLAAVKNSVPLVNVLLKSGADPNAVDRATGSTALHVAVSKGNVPMAAALLQGRALTNMKNLAGETALSIAVSSKKKEMVLVLSEKIN